MKRLFSLFIIATIWACNSNERVKPATISKDAIWKGGDDGGCWVLFGKVSENTIEATIFYENGDIWVKGIFKNKEIVKSQHIFLQKKYKDLMV
jgi:hypothetical protein